MRHLGDPGLLAFAALVALTAALWWRHDRDTPYVRPLPLRVDDLRVEGGRLRGRIVGRRPRLRIDGVARVTSRILDIPLAPGTHTLTLEDGELEAGWTITIRD